MLIVPPVVMINVQNVVIASTYETLLFHKDKARKKLFLDQVLRWSFDL